MRESNILPEMSEEQAKSQIRRGAEFSYVSPKSTIKYVNYWTPDGRSFKAIPRMVDYVIKDAKGNATGGGTRDANLDNGWLLQKPEVLIPRCLNCGMWHKTPAEAEVCEIQIAKQREEMDKVVKKDIEEEMSSKDNQIIQLTKQVEELTKLVNQVLQKGGK